MSEVKYDDLYGRLIRGEENRLDFGKISKVSEKVLKNMKK